MCFVYIEVELGCRGWFGNPKPLQGRPGILEAKREGVSPAHKKRIFAEGDYVK